MRKITKLPMYKYIAFPMFNIVIVKLLTAMVADLSALTVSVRKREKTENST